MLLLGYLGMLLGVNEEEWRSWCGLKMVVVLQGGRANVVVIPAAEY